MNFRLLYVSKAADNLTSEDLTLILKSAHSFNPTHDITGLLLLHEGTFLQVLEGDRDTVMALLQKIEDDPRNEELDVIFEEESGDRLFGNWSMNYLPLNSQDMAPSTELANAVIEPEELYSRISEQPNAVAEFFVNVLKDKVKVDPVDPTIH